MNMLAMGAKSRSNLIKCGTLSETKLWLNSKNIPIPKDFLLLVSAWVGLCPVSPMLTLLNQKFSTTSKLLLMVLLESAIRNGLLGLMSKYPQHGISSRVTQLLPFPSV